MKIVFIASLARSGSSAFGLLLGTHPNLVSLGEVYQVLGPRFDLTKTTGSSANCTCGHLAEECIFWGPMLSELRRHKGENTGRRYLRLIDVFGSIFGPSAVPVDSSKELAALKSILSTIDPKDTKVLHLLRDVRSWTAAGRKKEITVRVPPPTESTGLPDKAMGDEGLVQLETAPHDLLSRGYTVRRNRGGNGRPGGFDVVLAVPPSTGHSPTRLFLTWYFRNRQIGTFLAAKGVPNFTVGYEEFALKTEPVMEKVYAFLGLELPASIGQLEPGSSHAITGNRMIRDEHRKTRIEYDADWMFGDAWIGPSLFLPFVTRYNTQNVYRNLSRGSVI